MNCTNCNEVTLKYKYCLECFIEYRRNLKKMRNLEFLD